MRVRHFASIVALAGAMSAARLASVPSAMAQQFDDGLTSRVDAGVTAAADAGLPPPPTFVLVPADAATVVAQGRGVSVSAAELMRAVDDGPEPSQRRWAADPRLLDELLDRLVSDRLLANEARRLGLDRDPVVQAVVERALIARLRATVVDANAGDASNVTDDEIRAFYDAHPARFHIPERRTARVIFVTTRREAQSLIRLSRVNRHGRVVNDFATLALERNRDSELAQTGGEIRDVTLGETDLDPHVRDAIFAVADTGQTYSVPVRGELRSGQRGFFVVRLTGRRPAIDRTLLESSDWIRQRLVLQHRVDAERALVDRLARDSHLTRLPAAQVVRIGGEDAGAVFDAGFGF